MTIGANTRQRVMNDLADVGLTFQQIAARCGVTFQMVHMIYAQMRYENPDLPTGRERQKQRTARRAARAAILMNGLCPSNYQAVAESMGISADYVYRLLKRRSDVGPTTRKTPAGSRCAREFRAARGEQKSDTSGGVPSSEVVSTSLAASHVRLGGNVVAGASHAHASSDAPFILE